MFKLNISFDGEEHGYYNVVLFHIFCKSPNMIWFDSVFKSLQRQSLC
jgi:hypothetical protein